MTGLEYEEVKDILTKKELQFAFLERSIGDFCDLKFQALTRERDEWRDKALVRPTQLTIIQTNRFVVTSEKKSENVVIQDRIFIPPEIPKLTLATHVSSIACFPVASPPRTVYRKTVVSSDSEASPVRRPPRFSNSLATSFASLPPAVCAISSSDSDGSLDDLVSTTLRLSRASRISSFGSTNSSLVRYSTESSRRHK